MTSHETGQNKVRTKTINTTTLYRLTDFNDDMSYKQSLNNHSVLTSRTKEGKILQNNAMDDNIAVKIMKCCSRYDACSVPKCPMDILINKRTETDEDPKCDMAKATRHKYWESMPSYLRSMLPFQGYYESEYNRIKAARERWESMTDSDRQKARERLMSIRSQKPGDGPQ